MALLPLTPHDSPCAKSNYTKHEVDWACSTQEAQVVYFVSVKESHFRNRCMDSISK
jgi:hypothetical protein